jgi:hypothetical protein
LIVGVPEEVDSSPPPEDEDEDDDEDDEDEPPQPATRAEQTASSPNRMSRRFTQFLLASAAGGESNPIQRPYTEYEKVSSFSSAS